MPVQNGHIRSSVAQPFTSPLDMIQLLLRKGQTSTIRIMTELLISLPILLNDDLIGLTYRPDLEEAVHIFQRNRLGLRDQEPDENNAADHHGSKEEEHSSAGRTHVVEHLWREAADDEVPEPVVGGGGGLAEATGVHVEHFAVEDPGCAVP